MCSSPVIEVYLNLEYSETSNIQVVQVKHFDSVTYIFYRCFKRCMENFYTPLQSESNAKVHYFKIYKANLVPQQQLLELLQCYISIAGYCIAFLLVQLQLYGFLPCNVPSTSPVLLHLYLSFP